MFITASPAPLKSHDIAALIVTPTRELAIQIDHVIRTLLYHLPTCKLTIQLFIGGCGPDDDMIKFKQEGCVTITIVSTDVMC